MNGHEDRQTDEGEQYSMSLSTVQRLGRYIFIIVSGEITLISALISGVWSSGDEFLRRALVDALEGVGICWLVLLFPVMLTEWIGDKDHKPPTFLLSFALIAILFALTWGIIQFSTVIGALHGASARQHEF